jgi:hypothetical protein
VEANPYDEIDKMNCENEAGGMMISQQQEEDQGEECLPQNPHSTCSQRSKTGGAAKPTHEPDGAEKHVGPTHMLKMTNSNVAKHMHCSTIVNMGV